VFDFRGQELFFLHEGGGGGGGVVVTRGGEGGVDLLRPDHRCLRVLLAWVVLMRGCD